MFVNPEDFFNYYRLSSKFKIGIYGIYCLANNKIYIGQSTNILKRFSEHKGRLKRNRHKNSKLQCAWNKYGVENFYFFYIQETLEENLTDKEFSFYKLFSEDNKFNLAEPAERLILSNESRLKIGKSSKGRKVPIESVCSSLTIEDVLEIKELIYKKTPNKEIAKKYNVSVCNIQDIKMGKTWTRVTNIKRRELKTLHQLSTEEVLKIKHLVLEKSAKEVAEMFNICIASVRNIKSGRSYSEITGIQKPTKIKKRLSKEDILCIKDLLKNGILQKEIATKFNITASHVGDIKAGIYHKDIV